MPGLYRLGRELVNRPQPYRTAPGFLVYAASNCVDFREAAFDALVQLASSLGQNHELPTAMGRCYGSHPELRRIGPPRSSYPQNFRLYDVLHLLILDSVGTHILKRFAFLHSMAKFRFSLVMENSVHGGYVTEKIAQAFLGNSIPVYYGTKDVFKVFNDQAFIFYDPHVSSSIGNIFCRIHHV